MKTQIEGPIESKFFELTGAGTVVLRTVAYDPNRLNAEEVLAKTIYSTLSPGTELAAYRGDPPLRPGKNYPRLLGYCNVGEVLAVGSQVTKFQVGDRILTFQSHRSAFQCSQDSIILKIPDKAPLAEISTVYLFHLGYNALLKGSFVPGYNVAVVGLGALGLATISLVNAFGGRAYAFSTRNQSAERAKHFGARYVFPTARSEDNPDPVQLGARRVIEEDTNGTGIDLVVTSSGSWSDWELAISLPRKGGTICVLGFPGRTQPIPTFNPLDTQFFYDNQLSYISCGYSPDYDISSSDIRFTVKRNCHFLLQLVMEGKLPVSSLISIIVPWGQLDSIYKTMLEQRGELITAVLDWK